MRELCVATGLSDRTIRKYMQDGLIPKSKYRGTRTVYDDEQRIRLLVIKKMTLDGAEYPEIKAAVRKMSREEAMEYAELAPPAAPLPSGADSIADAPTASDAVTVVMSTPLITPPAPREPAPAQPASV